MIIGTELSPVVDTSKIRFDAYGGYEIAELTEAELMEVSGGASANNFFCPQGSNIFYCPSNGDCLPQPPAPPPPPPRPPGEDTDAD